MDNHGEVVEVGRSVAEEDVTFVLRDAGLESDRVLTEISSLAGIAIIA